MVDMMTLKQEIRNAFNRSAITYERAAKVQLEIGHRLFERLDLLKMTPRYVLDLGCGPGHFLAQFKQRYPEAHVVGLDIALEMLRQAQWQPDLYTLLNADMTRLPFESGQFDLVFASQVIHWSADVNRTFTELNRVMSPGGCLMFSTLGPDTFQELRVAFQSVDEYAHVNDFMDMHDVGDALLRASFLDPVVDMEQLTAHYPTLQELLQSLKQQGVRNVHANRQRGLTSKQAWIRLEQAMQAFKTTEEKWPLTYEVVYGHAWKGYQQGHETIIPVEQLRQKRG